MTGSSTIYRLTDLVDPGAVAARLHLPDDESVIRHAAGLLAEVGAVDGAYADAAVARERTYPTGLGTEPIGVALPHVDHGVQRPAIALLTLREPVLFGEMGEPQRQVPVAIVLMLAIPAGDAHVEVLGLIADLIQQPSFLEALSTAESREVLYQSLLSWANNH